METIQLPPIAVTIGEIPTSGHLEVGQEVTLTFHAIPYEMQGTFGFVLQALGGRLTAEGNKVVCRLKFVKDVVTFSPAHIGDGEMQCESQHFTSDDR